MTLLQHFNNLIPYINLLLVPMLSTRIYFSCFLMFVCDFSTFSSHTVLWLFSIFIISSLFHVKSYSYHFSSFLFLFFNLFLHIFTYFNSFLLIFQLNVFELIFLLFFTYFSTYLYLFLLLILLIFQLIPYLFLLIHFIWIEFVKHYSTTLILVLISWIPASKNFEKESWKMACVKPRLVILGRISFSSITLWYSKMKKKPLGTRKQNKKIINLLVMISGLNWLLLIWTWGAAWFGWSVEALTVATTGWVEELRSFWTFSKMTPEMYKVADMTVTTLKYDPVSKCLKIC